MERIGKHFHITPNQCNVVINLPRLRVEGVQFSDLQYPAARRPQQQTVTLLFNRKYGRGICHIGKQNDDFQTLEEFSHEQKKKVRTDLA